MKLETANRSRSRSYGEHVWLARRARLALKVIRMGIGNEEIRKRACAELVEVTLKLTTIFR